MHTNETRPLIRVHSCPFVAGSDLSEGDPGVLLDDRMLLEFGPFFRIVDSKVRAATFLTRQRTPRDQQRHLMKIARFRLGLVLFELFTGLSQPRAIAYDAAFFPRDPLDLQAAQAALFHGWDGDAGPAGRACRTALPQCPSCPRAKHYGFQQ